MRMTWRACLSWFLIALAAVQLCITVAMMRKTERAYDSNTLAAKRFRHNALDLFASNEISAARTQELINDASAAGAGHLRDLLARAGKNANRSLTRRTLQHRSYPKLYTAKVRCWNTKTSSEEESYISLLLPH